MALFGRRKPLHERLAEQGGLRRGESPPPDLSRGWMETGIHGVARLREWDVTAVAEAELDAAEATFVALPDGELLVEEGPDGDLSPLADALERAIDAPYRAVARRQGDRLWTVGAKKIDVLAIPEAVGEEIQLTTRHAERTVVVDGAQAFGSVPSLERFASVRYDDYVARASRLDGELWEVEVTPL